MVFSMILTMLVDLDAAYVSLKPSAVDTSNPRYMSTVFFTWANIFQVVDEHSKTPFVKLQNRMIVLLSRARLGMYILGNLAARFERFENVMEAIDPGAQTSVIGWPKQSNEPVCTSAGSNGIYIATESP